MANIQLVTVEPPELPSETPGGFLQSLQKISVGDFFGTLDADTAMFFTNVPGGARSLVFNVEDAGNANGKPIARFRTTGLWPDQADGHPVYDGATIEVTGYEDVKNFRIISADGGQHKISITFYAGVNP